MKKCNNVTRLTIASTIAAATLAALVLPTVGNSPSALAEGAVNKTAILNTSFFTRVTAPYEYSAFTNHTGVSVELDVVYSELKTEKNVQAVQANVSKEATGSAWNLTKPNAGVTFDFWNASTDLQSESVEGLMSKDQGGNGSTALTYYADGSLMLYFVNSAGTRTVSTLTTTDGEGNVIWNEAYNATFNGTYQSGTKLVGNVDEVATFLDAGYSYKVDFLYGFVKEDLTVVPGVSYRADGYGAIYNPWYVVSKKAIGATEWEKLFAIPLNRNLVAGTAKEGACYGGFELMANAGTSITNMGAGKYGNHQTSVKWELDNVAIYSHEANAVRSEMTFDGLDDAAFLLDESNSTVESAGTTYNGALGANMPNVGANYYDKYNELKFASGGITVNSINAPMEGMGECAKRNLNSRPIYTVEYKDRSTDKTIATRYVMKGLDALEPSYRETGTLYKWESVAENVTTDMIIYGSEHTDPFTLTFDLSGGTGTVEPIKERFGTEIDLTAVKGEIEREHYDFVGWAVKEADGTLKPITSYTVSDHDEILYAVWTPTLYSVKFYNEQELLYEAKVLALSDAVYEGSEPRKEGEKFLGWSETLDNIQGDKTVYAVFDDSYDEKNSDFAAKVSLNPTSAQKTLFIGRPYTETKESASVTLDFLKMEKDGVNVYVVLGLDTDGAPIKIDVTPYITEYCTISVKFSAYGKYTVSVKATSESVDAFQEVATGLVSVPYGNGGYGFLFEVEPNKAFSAVIDDLSVFANGLEYVEDFNYNTDLTNGSKLFKNGVTAFESSVANTLNVSFEDKPKKYGVVYKDGSTQNVLESRSVREGETASLCKVKGYTVTATASELDKLENISADITVFVTLNANEYSIIFNTPGTEDSHSVKYNEKYVFPTLEIKEAYGLIGWSRSQTAITPDYKLGQEISMPSENLVLYPVYGYRSFTVTFEDGNGNVLGIVETVYQGTAIYAGDLPQREGYKFVGWDGETSAVTSDRTVKPVFEPLESPPTQNAPISKPTISKTNETGAVVILVVSIAFVVVGSVLIVLGSMQNKRRKKKDE